MRGVVQAVTFAIALAALLPVAAKDSRWHTRLSPVPIDATTAAKITGHGQAAAELQGRDLHVTGMFEGMQGAATAAELHVGPYTGVRGKAIADLTVSRADSGTLSGTVRLTAEQIDALRAGRLYVRIDSSSAPDGNLWGWLLP